MGEAAAGGLGAFSPLIRGWFGERFGVPTDVQRRAWPAIAAGEHLLVTAPTGSGKTLAAFLWAIQRLSSGELEGGTVRVLYVSPLKALNNDVARNLLSPLAELRERAAAAGAPWPAIRVQTRSGDTPEAERRRMARRPPEILITTPESLNLLLLSKRGRVMLDAVDTVILDEIHAVADSKRGVYLMTAVERLTRLSGEVQRLALSATVRPLETVAALVGGYRQTGPESFAPRPVSVLRAADEKRVTVAVACPERIRERLVDGSRYPALIDDLHQRIQNNRSTLIFTNNRKRTEKIARLLNGEEDPPRVYPHHGSLSREVRRLVEKRFKAGQLAAIVATSSLELGIDIGDLDEVVLIDAPRTLSSGIQRVGRAGHGVGAVSRGVIYPTHVHAFVDAAAMTRLIEEKVGESVRPIRGALDVLAQVIVATCVNESWQLDDLFGFIRTCWSFHELSRADFDRVIEMLAGRYADSHIRELTPRVRLDRLAGTLVARDGARLLLARAGGVIPDRGYYNIRLQGSGALVGQLDEEFVWERRVGEVFNFGAQAWRIEQIGHNDVEVVGAGGSGMPPFWRGEAIDRDFELSARIGELLAAANDRLEDPGFAEELRQSYHLDESSCEELLGHLRHQRAATGAPLPHRFHVLVEHYSDPTNATDQKQVILHAPWGGRILRPLAICLQAAFDQQHRLAIEVMANDEGIALALPHAFSIDELLAMVPPDQIEALLRRKLEATGFFGARFREAAAIALLLPRQHPRQRLPLWLNRLRAKKLLASVGGYDDFPILLETWRSCLSDHFDLDGLRERLAELAAGSIAVTEVKTTHPSPFAADLVWRGIDRYMYQDDTPGGAGPSRLRDGLIAELVASPGMRPQIPPALVAELTAKLQRTHPGYAPADAGDLHDLLAERGVMPLPQWRELLAATTRDQGAVEAEGAVTGEGLVAELGDRVVQLSLPQTSAAVVVALERVPEIAAALGLATTDLTLRSSSGAALSSSAAVGLEGLLARRGERDEAVEADAEDRLDALLVEVARFYGPLPPGFLGELLGLEAEVLGAAINRLCAAETWVCDRVSQEARSPELCDAENLERLLRMARAAQRPSFEPLPIAALPLFTARWQGVVTPAEEGQEALQGALQRLFGWVAPVSAWESELLPVRVPGYQPAWLDATLQQSDLIWFGAGEGRVGFCFEDWLDLFVTGGGDGDGDRGDVADSPKGADTAPGDASLLPSPVGRFDLRALRDHHGLPTAELVNRVWRSVWATRMSNDTFASLRAGLATDFAPPKPQRPRARRHGSWQPREPLFGSWFALPKPAARDALEEEELNRDRVRQLFARYGVLFRQRLAQEAPALSWRALLRTLRLMEFSGEAFAGHFFTGINGLQFADPAALRQLRTALPEEAVYWLNALDPASLCGCGLEALRGELPARVAGTHLVYRGRELIVVSKRQGRRLEIRIPPEDRALLAALELFRDLLSRPGMAGRAVTVEMINDEPAPTSPHAPVLQSFGFAREVKSLVLSRAY